MCDSILLNVIIALTYTDPRVSDISRWVLVEEGFAGFTVATHGVVKTVVTHTSTDIPHGQIHRHIKMTLVGVAITVALFAKSKKKVQRSNSTHYMISYILY